MMFHTIDSHVVVFCVLWSVCEKNVCSFQISEKWHCTLYTFCNGKFNFMANLIKNFNEDGIFWLQFD